METTAAGYSRAVVAQLVGAILGGFKGPLLGFLIVVIAYLIALWLVPDLAESFWEDVRKGAVVLGVVVVGLVVFELVRAQYRMYRQQGVQIAGLQQQLAGPPPVAPVTNWFVNLTPEQLAQVLNNNAIGGRGQVLIVPPATANVPAPDEIVVTDEPE